MLHSALINVMVKAARRAGRSLKRDLGEIENLQVSLKGPANFVSLADKRAALDKMAALSASLMHEKAAKKQLEEQEAAHRVALEAAAGREKEAITAQLAEQGKKEDRT